MVDPSGQSFIIRLSPRQARYALEIVDRPDSPYSSISELVQVALENQFGIEPSANGVEPARDSSGGTRVDEAGAPAVESAATRSGTTSTTPTDSRPLDVPASSARRNLQPPAKPTSEPLSSFTNRLAPLVVGPRVLARMDRDGKAPSLDAFADESARAARELGMRLRTEDQRAGRRGRARRSTGWPIGDDELKSLTRFRNSFLAKVDRGKPAGPLVDLGLVSLSASAAHLTPGGANFASLPIPAFDDRLGGEILTEEHRNLLTAAVVRMPGERREVLAFLESVARAGGDQELVDRETAAKHAGWSEAQVVSHRAAMIGRLRDLAVVDVETMPGGKVRIVPGPRHSSMLQTLAEANTTGGQQSQKKVKA